MPIGAWSCAKLSRRTLLEQRNAFSNWTRGLNGRRQVISNSRMFSLSIGLRQNWFFTILLSKFKQVKKLESLAEQELAKALLPSQYLGLLSYLVDRSCWMVSILLKCLSTSWGEESLWFLKTQLCSQELSDSTLIQRDWQRMKRLLKYYKKLNLRMFWILTIKDCFSKCQRMDKTLVQESDNLSVFAVPSSERQALLF